MRKYLLYLDDGHNVYKLAIPAKNEKSAKEYVAGNGEVIATKDITDDCYISIDKIAEALIKSSFGEIEIDLITRTLQMTNIAK